VNCIPISSRKFLYFNLIIIDIVTLIGQSHTDCPESAYKR